MIDPRIDQARELYHELILEEARSPQNYGELAEADARIEGRNASCGDEVTIFLKLDPTRKLVKQIGWTGQGCVMSQAAMSVLSGLLVGKPLVEVQRLTRADLEAALGIDVLSVGRIKCVELGLKTLQEFKP